MIISSTFLNSEVKGMEPSEQRLLLPPSFTCDGRVTKWTVALQGVQYGGGQNGEAEHYPELQVWRKNGLQNFSKRASTILSPNSLVHTAHANVYDVAADSVEFEEGDYFGLYQPGGDSDVPIVHYLRAQRRNILMRNENNQDTLESDDISMCSDPPSDIACANPLVSVQTGNST